MHSRNSETISQKADRLKNSSQVILTGPYAAVVIGDHDTYDVSYPGRYWRCTCPWGRYKGHVKPCSHVTAVRRALQDPTYRVPFSRLAEILSGAAG